MSHLLWLVTVRPSYTGAVAPDTGVTRLVSLTRVDPDKSTVTLDSERGENILVSEEELVTTLVEHLLDDDDDDDDEHSFFLTIKTQDCLQSV